MLVFAGVLKKFFIEFNNFNQSVDTAKSNLQSLQNKTAEKAALEIANSVKDLKNRNLIMSKLQEAGLVPKDVEMNMNVMPYGMRK